MTQDDEAAAELDEEGGEEDAAAEIADTEDPAGPVAAEKVAEAPWSVAEWAVALRFDHPRATVLVLLLSDNPLRVLGFQTP